MQNITYIHQHELVLEFASYKYFRKPAVINRQNGRFTNSIFESISEYCYKREASLNFNISMFVKDYWKHWGTFKIKAQMTDCTANKAANEVICNGKPS